MNLWVDAHGNEGDAWRLCLEHHIVDIVAWAAHRQNVVFLEYGCLQQEGSISVEHLLYGVVEVLATGHGACRDIVSLGNLFVVGVHHRSEGVAIVEEQVLPLSHIAQVVVVEQNDFTGERCSMMVPSSSMVICKPPSPKKRHTVRCGAPKVAPMAAGSP